MDALFSPDHVIVTSVTSCERLGLSPVQAIFAMSSLTDEFRRVLPFALYSASPKLSALHATRRKLIALKSTTPDSNIASTSSCPKCGVLRLTRRCTSRTPLRTSGGSRASKDPNDLKVLPRGTATCANCGSTYQATSTAKHPTPSVRHMKRRRSRAINNEIDIDSSTSETPAGARPIETNPISTTANSSARPSAQPANPTEGPARKSRPKKRVGLQEVLARNRSQKEKSAAEAKHRAGLADFLVGL